MPHFTDSAGSPKSVASVQGEADQSIINLRARVIGQTVSLYGFDLDTPDPLVRHMGKLLKDSVSNFLTKWFGLRVIPFGQNANIIIANEAAPTATSNLAYQFTTKQKGPTVLVLCSHSSRFDRTVPPNTSTRSIGFVAKPVGPLKLARALVQCLDGIPPVVTPGIGEPQPASERTDLSSVFEGLSPMPNAGEMLDNSRMSADSNNARKAIESPTPGVPSEKYAEYPFPIEAPVSTTQRTAVASGHDISSSGLLREVGAGPVSSAGLPIILAPPSASKPRLLLVDDNIINLTLLRTYMHKRQYDIVDEAENGLDAVNKFNERTDGYDIIFMDISMPILDGFGASRQIRAIEESRRNTAVEDAGMKKGDQPSALIIALTGLASIQDQSEALSSGIDLYLTKPVSFREVGRMLDNWEANR
jgi:CheY-like chemotaxis protein